MAVEVFYIIRVSVKEQWSIHKLGPPVCRVPWVVMQRAVCVQAKGKEGLGFEDLLLHRLTSPSLWA